MRIEVVDPSGCGLGPAIGLAQLGHAVSHRGPSHWATAIDDTARCSRELQQRFLQPHPVQGAGPDLVVLIDVFTDYVLALERGTGAVPGVEVRDPLDGAAGTLVYPDRLQWYCERAAAAERLVIVDMSDAMAPREVALEMFPQATLLARECPARGDGRWRPFPFLYNHVMLWLEAMWPASLWRVPGSQRVRTHDWAFCGTVDHARYQGQRRRALASLAQRWPTLRGRIEVDLTFHDVRQVWQQVGFGVDLPGVGELCFRLHECLSLGTPLVRPLPARVALPPSLRAVVVDEPERLRGVDAEQVLAAYEAGFAPRAAAEWLLAAVEADSAVRAGRAEPVR